MVDLLALVLLFLGFLSAILNTVVGGGGGVVLTPLLILVFHHSANVAIATAFVAVTVGSVVSTFAYSRQGRVDYRIGLFLGGLTLPGVVLGAFLTSSVEGPSFDLILGAVVMLLAVLTWLSPKITPGTGAKEGWTRSFTDAFDTHFTYTVNRRVATPGALLTGWLAGIFGAGGGLLLTPTMIVAGFPVHIALATVRLVAALTALTASLTRFSLGQVELNFALWLSVGSLGGAFIGARLARIPKSEFLRKIVSLGILLLGLGLVLEASLSLL